jgi:hypothetical protein
MVLRTEDIQPFPEGPSYPDYFYKYFKAIQAVAKTLGKKRLDLVYSEEDTGFLNSLIFPRFYQFWIREIEARVDNQTKKKIFSDGDYPAKVYLITTHSAKPSQGLLLVNSQVDLEEVQEALLISKDLEKGHGEKRYQLVDVTTTNGVFAITLPKLGKTISAKGKISSNQPLPPEKYTISPKEFTTYGGITAETYSKRSSGLGKPDISLHQISHLSFSDKLLALIAMSDHPDAGENQVDAATDQLLKLTTKSSKKELDVITQWSDQAGIVVQELMSVRWVI